MSDDNKITLFPQPNTDDQSLAPQPGKCNRHNRQGFLCGQTAGWGTVHPGTGPCKLHGGRTPLGLSSDILHSQLGEKIEMYRNNPDRLRLDDIIATFRALADYFIVGDVGGEIPPNFDKAMMALSQATSAVKAQHDMLYARRMAVTVDQVKDLLDEIVLILKETLKDYPDLLETVGQRIQERLVMTVGSQVIEG
jgi:hypothetical protein